MQELPIDQMIKSLENPTTGTNLNSLMETIDQADKFLQQCEKLMSRFDAMGIKPLIVRAAGVKFGVDAETPLKTEIQFKSPTHKKFIEEINNLSEEDLLKQIEGVKNGGARS